MIQHAIDFTAAERRRDEGIQRAAEHADNESPGWTDVALLYLKQFLVNTSGPFLAEDVVAAAKVWGLIEPPDGRAWGHVMRRAAKLGLVVKAGYAPAKTSNCSPKVLWRKA